MISPGRLIAAFSTLLLLTDIPIARASEFVDADDLSYALALLEASGVDTTPDDQIQRVLRDELETVVWVQSSFEGLPVFFHNVGYVFEPDGQPSTGPGSDAPLILGDPLPGRQSFPLDHHPDISEEKAFEAFRERLAAESSNAPEAPLEAVLGFHNLKLGSGDPAEYRLAWRVRPIGVAYPEVMVSAKKGDVLYSDSGRRSNGPSGPGPEDIVLDPRGDDGDQPSRSPTVTGTWYSPRCEERSYTRSLTLKEDGTFLASDLVAPCPKDAQCIWSGIVGRSGTWQFDRDMIELTFVSESQPGRASPLPQLLRREGEAKLVEVVVGGPMTCEYRRKPEVVQEASVESRCRDAVQGHIAWDYNGSTQWAGQNLTRLCAGAEDSTEPGICFEEAMHGGLPGRSSTEWRWQDAVALCAGTTDAQTTVGCYQAEVHSGSGFEQAITACGT